MEKLTTKDGSEGGSLNFRLVNSMAVDFCEQGRESEARDMWRHTGTRQGRRRLFEHMGSHEEQVETLWESGKTIRHVTQEEGQGTSNEREVNIQNKTGNYKTRHESKPKDVTARK